MSVHVLKSRPPETERDQNETDFTPILRKIWQSVPNVLAAVFIDGQGECIDYVSSVDPYEAKVAAAHSHVMLEMIRAVSDRLRLIEPHSLELTADSRELITRRLGDDYMLSVLLSPGFDREQLQEVLVLACRAFREEVGIAMPAWEPASTPLEVVVRSAVGWKYAPDSFTEAGRRVTITDVMGRWTEASRAGDDGLVCFRVRTGEGRELTLVHDPDEDGWLLRL